MAFMSHILTAVFENGILRPDQPLKLPDGSRVEITVRPTGDVLSQHGAALADFDQVCGEIVIPPEAHRMSREEMYQSRTK